MNRGNEGSRKKKFHFPFSRTSEKDCQFLKLNIKLFNLISFSFNPIKSFDYFLFNFSWIQYRKCLSYWYLLRQQTKKKHGKKTFKSVKNYTTEFSGLLFSYTSSISYGIIFSLILFPLTHSYWIYIFLGLNCRNPVFLSHSKKKNW